MTDDSDKSAAGPEEGVASAMTRNRMIKRTYEDPPTNELMDVYAAWANDYDSDLIDGHGYMAPEDAVAGFVTLGLASDARILDAGCGTGWSGCCCATCPWRLPSSCSWPRSIASSASSSSSASRAAASRARSRCCASPRQLSSCPRRAPRSSSSRGRRGGGGRTNHRGRGSSVPRLVPAGYRRRAVARHRGDSRCAGSSAKAVDVQECMVRYEQQRP